LKKRFWTLKDFKNWAKSIQAAGYNGARTVFCLGAAQTPVALSAQSLYKAKREFLVSKKIANALGD
jgi:hypothetical protein